MKLLLSAGVFSLSLAFALQTSQKPAFEVASVKPSDPNPSNAFFIGMSADRAMVTYRDITLKDCIRTAYRVRDFQVVGPDWISRARYQISAKLSPGASPDQIPEMLQTLLAERFKLTLERDTREQPVYALLVGKDGPKLKPSEAKTVSGAPTALGPDGKPRAPMMFRLRSSAVTATAPSATLPAYAELLSRFTARPVVDMTGIDGQYAFNMMFQPERTPAMPFAPAPNEGEPPDSEPAPPLADAVKQYGLRIESRKAPLEIFTVTHAERNPTEN